MRHNKFVGTKSGLETFLGLVEQVQKLSPWLSRQIAKHASDWPFWYSGLRVEEWDDRHVRLSLPKSKRNAVDDEISHGHLALGAELAVRLILIRLSQEFPFRFRVVRSSCDTVGEVYSDVQYRLNLPLEEWDELRREMARHGRVEHLFVVQAFFADGRMAASFDLTAAFRLEKSLSA